MSQPIRPLPPELRAMFQELADHVRTKRDAALLYALLLAHDGGVSPKRWPWVLDTAEGLEAEAEFYAKADRYGVDWAKAWLDEHAAKTLPRGERVIRGLTRRAVKAAFDRVSSPDRRATRAAVAKELDVSEATLERACKEGLDCHPWPGSLQG